MPDISPKAVVTRPEALADDVRVGAFSYVGPDVTIAAGTVLANNVTVVGRTSVGAGCAVHPGAVVGTETGGAAGTCTLGDGNVIREHVIIAGGTDPSGPGTVVGADNLFMVGCLVGHDAQVGAEGIFANFTHIEPYACIEPFVRTSAFTVVRRWATVGAYAFATGYAAIERDAPPFAIVQGLPAVARSVNSENLRRCGFDKSDIEALKGAFRLLFNGDADTPDEDALGTVQAQFDNPYVRTLIDSIRRSAAGPSGRHRQDGKDTGAA